MLGNNFISPYDKTTKVGSAVVSGLNDELSKAEGFLWKLFDVRDIDKMDFNYLPLIARVFGIEFKSDLSESRIRAILDKANWLRMMKGTKIMLRTYWSMLFGAKVDVTDNLTAGMPASFVGNSIYSQYAPTSGEAASGEDASKYWFIGQRDTIIYLWVYEDREQSYIDFFEKVWKKYMPAQVDTELRFQVVDEQFHIANLDEWVQLKHQNLFSENVTSLDGSITYVKGTDYDMDYTNGKIMALTTGTMTTGDYYIDYWYRAYWSY